MKFLNGHTHILHGLKPIDMNDCKNENTAVELALLDNFSAKAKTCWNYFSGSAFIFEYKNRIVVTDENLYLTEHGDGKTAPYGGPRWECNSWDELEQILETTCDELVEDGMVEEAWNWAMEA